MKIDSPGELQQAMGTDFCLSEQQWAAVSASLQPAVVVAGAGSGKTTLMAARVFYLVATGQVEPHEVLGLTFTTKAAAGLASSITKALAAVEQLRPREEGEEKLEPTVSTYNAYAAQLLSEHGLRIGHEPDTRVMADASRYQLAERAMLQRTRPVRSGLSDSPTHVIKWLLELEGAMGEHLVTADDVRAFHARQRPRFEESIASSKAKAELNRVLAKMDEREELLELAEDYRRLKAELGLMDFSDQIALAARLADDHPAVGFEERAKYRIVLLDEYQDTSVAQARMLSRLFSGDTPEAGRGHPVTAVGDPNQAIYGWRGASVSNILRFGDAFPLASNDTDVPTYPLTVNRRSDRRILDVANELAKPLYEEFDQVRPLEPKPEAADGEIRVSVHETYAAELAWLPEQVLAARRQILAERGPDKPAWREIGVLTRDNATAADVFDALTAREIPVEIVGLSGLLRLPEVGEVVATMTLLHDLTANAELLTILTGPRWAVGPRDLAILGRRAGDLAHRRGRKEGLSLIEELQEAVSGADPTEILSLGDALADPGDQAEYPYSRQARERFALLAHELKWLRTHVGEPLLDLVRRIIDVTGLDVELASSVSPAAAARRDNLDLFVKAVAEFQAIDGQVTLPALLAYLTAEDELGNGLDIATPTEADSVKLLTVHRAKGLEYDAVFLVGVCEEKFPNKQVRSQWTRGQWVLPAPLRGDAVDVPQLKGYEANDLKKLIDDARGHQAMEELRLGYVAFTRARHLLSVSSYLWHDSRLTPVAPSPYQRTAKVALEACGLAADSWLEKPEEGTPNPIQAGIASHPWPVTEHTAEALRRIEGAELVRAAMAGELSDDDLDLAEQARVDEWDRELDRLLEEARRSRRTELAVPLPSSLSATALGRVRDDPEAFARELARPMPRPPSPAARFGTRFHAWVEARFGQQDLFDPDELPGRGDVGIDDESDLKELIASFEQGEFAHRVPHAVEPPFALVLGGQVIRGRIDAVYTEDDGSFLVVDWKTNKAETADPLQLALYRLAWAELHDVPLDRVRAAFHYVRTGRTVEYDDLPDRAELERLLPTRSG